MSRCRSVLLTLALLGSAAAAPGAPVSAPLGDDILYRVRPGDTLFDLATLYFDRLQSYAIVRRINRIAEPRRILPGTVLRVPASILRAEPLALRLAAFRSDVTIRCGQDERMPQVGMEVGENCLLETGPGAFATLIGPDGSRVTMPSNSVVRIVLMRRYLMNGSVAIDLKVERGRLDSSIAPADKDKRSFRFRTPTAISAVRGTKLRVGHEDDDGISLTEVVEGKVAVEGGGGDAILQKGQGAVMAPGAAPAVEPLLPPPVLIEPGKAQKEPLVRFALLPMAAARRYHVQLARDAGFVELVGDWSGSEPAATFSGIEDGTYFVRVAAIAASGLEGMPEAFSVDRRLASIGGSAGASGPRGFLFKWMGEGKGRRSYRLQLYADPKGVPLVDEAGLTGNEIRLTALPSGSYWWRVGMRQVDAGRISENWTELEKITVSAPE